jgi:hypothetical protein
MWVWAYLALFGTGDAGTDTAVDSADGTDDSADETSNGPDTR